MKCLVDYYYRIARGFNADTKSKKCISIDSNDPFFDTPNYHTVLSGYGGDSTKQPKVGDVVVVSRLPLNRTMKYIVTDVVETYLCVSPYCMVSGKIALSTFTSCSASTPEQSILNWLANGHGTTNSIYVHVESQRTRYHLVHTNVIPCTMQYFKLRPILTTKDTPYKSTQPEIMAPVSNYITIEERILNTVKDLSKTYHGVLDEIAVVRKRLGKRGLKLT